jgi:hypothetical protein
MARMHESARRSNTIRRKVDKHWLMTPQIVVEPPMPRRRKLFIAGSTALFLALAGAIALWLPEYQAIAWALVLFSSCHAAFFLVLPRGQGPINDSGMAASDLLGDYSEAF